MYDTGLKSFTFHIENKEEEEEDEKEEEEEGEE